MSESTTSREAPGELELVRKFVNTVDLESGEDELSSPAAATRWLRSRRLLAARETVTVSEARQLVRLREAIRSLAAANGTGEIVGGVLDDLNAIAARLRLKVSFERPGEARLIAKSTGASGAIAKLLGIVYTAMADGRWTRLKACRRESCSWLFYDHSKNRSSRWCRMSICGNREKAASYRARHGAPRSKAS